jgi:membrane dipeptidase
MHALERFKRAGYTFVSATLSNWPASFDGTLAAIQKFKAMAEPWEGWFVFGQSLDDIDRGRRKEKLVMGINAQETRILGAGLTRVQKVVRPRGQAHAARLQRPQPRCRRLRGDGRFGRQVVKEMNRVGIVVDGSHTGRRSSLEAIELSERPPRIRKRASRARRRRTAGGSWRPGCR